MFVPMMLRKNQTKRSVRFELGSHALSALLKLDPSVAVVLFDLLHGIANLQLALHGSACSIHLLQVSEGAIDHALLLGPRVSGALALQSVRLIRPFDLAAGRLCYHRPSCRF